MDTDSLRSPLEEQSSASDIEVVCTQRTSDDTDYQHNRKKNVYDPPYFAPLRADDEYDVYDVELVLDAGGKQADVLIRFRGGSDVSSGRPTYKAEKKAKNHFLGKKNLSLNIFRSDGWDSATCKPVTNKGKAYSPILQCQDENPRRLSVTTTKAMVLHSTTRGGHITMTPYCSSYDPQRSRALEPRDCLTYHYVPLYITDFDRSPPTSGAPISKNTPAALTKPYSGGGYLVFDADSQGHQDLLCTLYCTGYERRHKVRRGDIALAEFRLTRPALDPAKAAQPLWRRFFRERHASLHISRRGLEAAFTGPHVNMAVPNPKEGSRYTLTPGQGHEIVASFLAMSLLAIEHDGLDSKKWAWLSRRETLSQSNGATNANRDNLPPEVPEKYPHFTTYESREELEPGFENMSVGDTASSTGDKVHSLKPTASFEQWKVTTYNSGVGETFLRPTEPSPVSDSPSPVSDDFIADTPPPPPRRMGNFHQHMPSHSASLFSQAHSVSSLPYAEGSHAHSRGSTSSPLSREVSEDAHKEHGPTIDTGLAGSGGVDTAFDTPISTIPMSMPEEMQRTSSPMPMASPSSPIVPVIHQYPKPYHYAVQPEPLAILMDDEIDAAYGNDVRMRKKPKERPPVTGRPKPGVEGGIYW